MNKMKLNRVYPYTQVLICCVLFLFVSCKQQEEITIELPEIVIEGAKHEFSDTSVHLVDSSQLRDEKMTIHQTPSEGHNTRKQIIPDSKTISDTTYHFYVNNKLSVKITSWNKGKRQIILYDLYGNITYTHEEVSLSYSVSCDLFFANNGSVEKIKCRTNPGASRFWYESEMTFNGTNTPIWKKTYKKPFDHIEDASGKSYFWDKKTTQWKKQEVINCNPPP